MPEYEFIAFDTTPEATWITLNRPERMNVLDDDVFMEIYDALIRATLDEEHSVVVFRGTGDIFSAGGNFKSQSAKLMMDGYSAENATEMYKHVLNEYPMFGAFERCPHTIIAAVHGDAYGAAVDLTMMCDLAIAAQGAKMMFAPGRFGLADAPNAARLPARIGIARAKDLLFTSRLIDSAEAYELGIVTRLCERENFDDEVRNYVRDVLTVAPTARRLVKEIMTRELPAFSPMEHFRTAIGPDYAAGVKAFQERRPIPWTAAALDAAPGERERRRRRAEPRGFCRTTVRARLSPSRSDLQRPSLEGRFGVPGVPAPRCRKV